MKRDSVLTRVALGAAAGFAGTVALQALMTASKRWAPGTLPPLREEPGEFMVKKAEEAIPYADRIDIPEKAETAAAQALALGYGLTFGALYGLLRPTGGPRLADGVALGLATWAAGYLGWLPATGLMPPLWKQNVKQAVAPAVEHAAYGVATVSAYDWMKDRWGRGAGS